MAVNFLTKLNKFGTTIVRKLDRLVLGRPSGRPKAHGFLDESTPLRIRRGTHGQGNSVEFQGFFDASNVSINDLALIDGGRPLLRLAQL